MLSLPRYATEKHEAFMFIFIRISIYVLYLVFTLLSVSKSEARNSHKVNIIFRTAIFGCYIVICLA